MKKIYEHLKMLSDTPIDEREMFLETIKMMSYSSTELTEHDMWILTTASENSDYLYGKLKEADEMSLDTEAPTETDELTLDAPEEGGEELTLDAPEEGGEELTLDAPTETETTEPTEEKEEIETSKEGIGILPLLGEIQDKLANGKPSEVELAALKALKKLVG